MTATVKSCRKTQGTAYITLRRSQLTSGVIQSPRTLVISDWYEVRYRAIIFVVRSRHSMFLVLPAGRLLLGILASEETVGPLQQRHVLLLHRAVRPLQLGPLVRRHHTRGRHLRPPGITARGCHTVVNPFPRLAEELLFFPAQYAYPYHL